MFIIIQIYGYLFEANRKLSNALLYSRKITSTEVVYEIDYVTMKSRK